MAELAEGARLLSECAVNAAPRVRIPLSPPYTLRATVEKFSGGSFSFVSSLGLPHSPLACWNTGTSSLYFTAETECGQPLPKWIYLDKYLLSY
jgi:hypothetical protein